MITKVNDWLLQKHADLVSMQADREEGQTMVEYGLVLVAVAIAALVAYKALGGRVGTFINNITF
jgi:Flp pilus assembly pilin Flp